MLKNFWMGKDKKLCVDVQMQDLHILDFLNNYALPKGATVCTQVDMLR
jgi:hypothetical protein